MKGTLVKLSNVMASTRCHYDTDIKYVYVAVHVYTIGSLYGCLWCDEIIVRFLQLVRILFFASHSLLHVYFKF